MQRGGVVRDRQPHRHHHVAGSDGDRRPTDPGRLHKFAASLGPDVAGSSIARSDHRTGAVPPPGERHVPPAPAQLRPGWSDDPRRQPVQPQPDLRPRHHARGARAQALQDHLARRASSDHNNCNVASPRPPPAPGSRSSVPAALPGVPAQPSLSRRIIGRYVRRVHAAASSDSRPAVAFTRLAGRVDDQGASLRLSIVRRTLAATPNPTT